MDERRLLLDMNDISPQEESGSSMEEEWSEGSSNSSSYFSDTDSSLPDWEASVSSLGQLLYIECHPFLTTNNVTSAETEIAKTSDNPLTRNTKSRKSTRSKFLRLIRRRDSKRRSKRGNKATSSHLEQEQQQSTSKVTFSDYQEGEIKLVTLALNSTSAGAHKMGRRTTFVETLLGITVSSFTDGNRIMVSGFAPDSVAAKEKNIKIGDWLKTINGIYVNTFNVKHILEELTADTVTIEFQRVAGVEVTNQPPANELSTQTPFVKKFIEYNNESDTQILEYLSNESIGVLFINTSILTETGPEYEGIIYSYPYPFQKNSLVSARGIFITLNNLIGDITNDKPKITTIISKSKLINVCYKSYESYLLLLMFPQTLKTNNEALKQIDELLSTLEFCYKCVNKCFEEQSDKELHHFFSRFFNNILADVNNISNKRVDFENILPLASFISLPKDADMQIDEALTDLEACDYRDWNEEPLDCQRLFTILGSALYHNGYLLATHLTPSDTTAVHTYCRSLGIFRISKNEPVRAMVLWREIYPPSCRDEQQNTALIADARQYLLIVGNGKDMLAVIMEAGGCTEPPEDGLGPDAFYVEEAQATLAHLQELGVSELAAKWIRTNPGTQIQLPQLPPPYSRRTDFLTTHIPFAGKPSVATSNPTTLQQTLAINKKQEVTSILKRRGSDIVQRQQSATNNSADSGNSAELLQSDDSVSQGGYSELSDDLLVTTASGMQQQQQQVLGRRAVREQRTGRESDDNDSDIEDYRDGSQLSNNSYDFAEIRQALLNESEGLQPVKLTVGNENVLYHYVHLNGSLGILLSPPDSTSNSIVLKDILTNFNASCHTIHGMFQNTLRFKNLHPHEMAKTVINKSVIAIKEYGTLFEYSYTHENCKKPSKVIYWVIGRLYYMSNPREMYVCYQDAIPQNLIEIAFKLGISNN